MADPIVSPALRSALDTYGRFLSSDDSEREQAIESSDRETLKAFANAIDQLYEEINAVLDRLVAAHHPLPDDQEQLEYDLHSLAQAAMEARLALEPPLPWASGRSPVELMMVRREPGRELDAECASCRRVSTLNHGLFVGSMGEPTGAIEVCDECAPRVERIAEALVDVLPPGVGAMLTAE
jgi:hypothetical protein